MKFLINSMWSLGQRVYGVWNKEYILLGEKSNYSLGRRVGSVWSREYILFAVKSAVGWWLITEY